MSHVFSNRTSTISLPPLHVVLASENLEMHLTASISLDLPETLGRVTTVEQLRGAVERDNLWIARLGTCCIEVSAAVDGDPSLESGQLGILARMIKSSEIWNRLGLRIEGDGSSAVQLPGLVPFSIQHPDLKSALLPPPAALVARFRALNLAVNISQGARPPKGSKAGRKKTKVKDQVAGGDDFFSTLDSNDRRAIDEFLSSLNLPSHLHSGVSVGDILEKISSLHLVDVTLERLLLGSKKRHRGIQITGGSLSHCLTKLAPAVFHVPYLKMIGDRAGLLSTISSSLARMRNAESPSVRQRVEGLGTQSTASLDEGNTVFRGIEKCGWDVLLAHCQAPPLKSVKRTATDQAAEREAVKMEPAPMTPLFGYENDQVWEPGYGWEGSSNLQALDPSVFPATAYDYLTPTSSQNTQDSTGSSSIEDSWSHWEQFNGPASSFY